MLNVRYDPVARTGHVRLRDGRTVRTRRLSEQAVAEYDRRNRLLAIQVTDLDERAAEFLRTADEETLLQVIRMQAGSSKAGSVVPERRDGERQGSPRDRPRPRPRARPAAKKAPPPAVATPEPETAPAAEAARKRRRRRRRSPASTPDATAD